MKFGLRSYRDEVASHRHAHHQLVLPRAGVLDIEIDGHGGRVESAQAALIGSGARHAFQAHGANSFLVLDLPERQLGARDERLLQQRFLALGPRTRLLLEGIDEQPPQRPQAVSLWAELLLDALHGSRIDGMTAACRLLETEPERPFGMRWLASLAGLGRAQFHRRFIARHGESPGAFQREHRLRRALELLRESRAPIARIAGEVGYSEHSALTRALRRLHGSPPRAFRDP